MYLRKTDRLFYRVIWYAGLLIWAGNLCLPGTPVYAMKEPARLSVHATHKTGISWQRVATGPQRTLQVIQDTEVFTTTLYLPLITGTSTSDTCAPIQGESYSDIPVNSPPTDRPAEQHADLNLALRGYDPTTAYLGLVDYTGGTDNRAPQLPGLFADNRTATFRAAYRVYDWDWACNCRGDLLSDWDVTLAGLAVTPGETIRVPDSGYSIGSGYEVLVLYASATRITLKYTREDNVVQGYTLHVEGVCVEPNLLALYQQWNNAGRNHLPALRAGQSFGRARSNEIGVAIRDYGAFLDPRSRKDWWRGR